MSREFREVRTRSWAERIGQSIGGAVIGLILFIGCIALLWWNEGRSVDRAETLSSGRDLVVSIPSDPRDAANQGRLVHVSGLATTEQTLEDPIFRLRARALRLVRTVEMYQWVEQSETRTVKQLGGGTTEETVYTYRTVWSEELIESADFKQASEHRNPAMPFRSTTFQATDVTVGAFRLAPGLRDMLHGEVEYPLPDAALAALPPSLQRDFALVAAAFVSGDLSNPKVGDMRVRFSWIAPADVSVIGRQDGGAIGPYRTPRGTLELLTMGQIDAEGMFAAAAEENTMLTWLVRVGGTLGICVGFALLLGPLARLADVVPILGSLVGGSIAMVAAAVGLTVGVATIGLAWLAYRPILAAALLTLSALLVGGLVMLRRRRTAPGPA